MLRKAFEETYRVLKPNKYLTVTFHNADIGVYNLVIRSVILSGFKLEKILYQHPPRASPKTLLAPYGSAEGDYYIRFKKPTIARVGITEKEVDELRFEKIVVQSVKTIIAVRGEPVTYNDILKHIYIELDKAGYLTIAKTEDIQKILEKYKGKEFVHNKGEGWFFKDPEEYFLHITPLQDRIENFVIQVVRRKVKVSFDDVLQEIFLKLENALTPEPYKVKTILEEYATQTKDKKWRIKPIVEENVREHSNMIGILAKIGKKSGYKVHIGKREQGDTYEKKLLSQLISKRLPSLSNEEKQIDILWIKNGKIHYSFEIEYTTSIWAAMIRGSYISNNKVIRVFVIPKDRQNLLYRKVNAPILRDRINEQNWKYIFFQDLNEFFISHKRKKQIDLDNFQKLFRKIREVKIKQTTFSNE